MVNPLRDCLGLIIQIITSTTGLFLLNLGYLLFGSYVFYILESPNEAQLVSDLADKRIYLIQQLDALERAAKTAPTDTTTSKDGVNDVKRNASILLADYEEKLADFYRKRAVLNINDESGSNATGQTKLWTPLGAIIYSYSVITTIGWGNIVPGTDNGKMVTIVYGIFGIPLLFALSTDTGNMVAAFNLRLWRLIHGTFSVASRVVGINKKSDDDEDEDDDDDNDNRWKDRSESNANALLDWNFPLKGEELTEKEKLDCLQVRQKLDGKLQHLSEDINSQTSYLKSAESTVNFMLDMALKNGPIDFEYMLPTLLPHKRILCQEDAIQLVQEIDSMSFSELKLCSELVGVPWRIFTRFFSGETKFTVTSTSEMKGDPEIGEGSNFAVTLSSTTEMEELTVKSGLLLSLDVNEAQATESSDAHVSEPVEKTKLTNRTNYIHQSSKKIKSECVVEPKLLYVFDKEDVDSSNTVSCFKNDCLDSKHIQGESAKVVMEIREGKCLPNTEDKCGSRSNEQLVDCTVSHADAYKRLTDKSGLLSTKDCFMNETALNDQLIEPSKDEGLKTLSQNRLQKLEALDSKTKKLALIFRKVLEVERLELVPGEAGKKKRCSRGEKVQCETGLEFGRRQDSSQPISFSQTKHVRKQSHSVEDTGIKSNGSSSGIKECSSKKSSGLDEASSRLSRADSLLVEVGSRLDDQKSSRSYSSGRQGENNAASIRHCNQKKDDSNNKPRIHASNNNSDQVKSADRVISQEFPSKHLDSIDLALRPANNQEAQRDNGTIKYLHPVIQETKEALQNSEVDKVSDCTSNKKTMSNVNSNSQLLRGCETFCKTLKSVNLEKSRLNNGTFAPEIVTKVQHKTTDQATNNSPVPSKCIHLNSNWSDFTFCEMPNALKHDTTGCNPNLPCQSHAASTKEPAKKVSSLVSDLNKMSDFVTLHARLNPNAKVAEMQDSKPETKLKKQNALIHGRSCHSKEDRSRDERKSRQECRSREGRNSRHSHSREGRSSTQECRSLDRRSTRQSCSREGRRSRQECRSREGSSRQECRFREGDVNQSADHNINYADFFGRGDDDDNVSLSMSEMSLDYSEYGDDDDVDDDDAEPEADAAKKEDESHLPLSVLYFFVIMYILAGSLVYFNFSMETENKFLNWVYFIYVTLSTTGFGDILPEEHMLLFTAIYGLLGMAIFNILLNGTLETFLYAIDYINAFNVGADDEDEDDD